MNEQIREAAAEYRAPSENQKEFLNRYNTELNRAAQAEKVANQQARDRLKGLSAAELRKIGAKQLLWGWGLSFINVAGVVIGGVGLGFGTAAVATTLGASALVAGAAAFTVGAVGYIGGAIAGSELVRSIYEKFSRKTDKSLPQLDKDDRLLGNALSVVTGGTWNPAMVAGVRNIFEGYNNMKSIQ